MKGPSSIPPQLLHGRWQTAQQSPKHNNESRGGGKAKRNGQPGGRNNTTENKQKRDCAADTIANGLAWDYERCSAECGVHTNGWMAIRNSMNGSARSGRGKGVTGELQFRKYVGLEIGKLRYSLCQKPRMS